MKIIRDGKEIELTSTEIEEAYRQKLLEYTIEDVKLHCEQEEIISMDDNDYASCAELALNYLEDNERYFDEYWLSVDQAIEDYFRKEF